MRVGPRGLWLLVSIGMSGGACRNVGVPRPESATTAPPPAPAPSPAPPADAVSADARAAPPTCRVRPLAEIPRKTGGGHTAVWFQDAPVKALGFEAGLAIDADGGRNAYRDDDKGLDTIKSACPPSRKGCWGIVMGPGDQLVRQAPPRQAYYVSPTSLEDPTKPRTDPARYVDAESIAYVVLPIKTLRDAARRAGITLGLALGDYAVVINRKNGRRAPAIFADAGPSDRIGEGSIALADALGIPSSPRHGGAADHVQIVVFPGSGDGKPHPTPVITAASDALLTRWGGPAMLDACRTPQGL